MTSPSKLLSLLAMFALIGCSPQVIEEPKEEEPSPKDIIGDGSSSNPYTVSDAQQIAIADGAWVCGYVVGSVSGSLANGCVWGVPTSISANILLADDTTSLNSQCVLPIQLTTNKSIRSRLNLSDNPSILHQYIYVRGDIATYYGVPGIRDITTYRLVGGEEISGNVTADDEWEGVIQ